LGGGHAHECRSGGSHKKGVPDLHPWPPPWKKKAEKGDPLLPFWGNRKTATKKKNRIKGGATGFKGGVDALEKVRVIGKEETS